MEVEREERRSYTTGGGATPLAAEMELGAASL